VGVGAEDELARPHERAFRQYLVADPGVAEEVADPEALHEVARRLERLRHPFRRRGEVVVEDHDHALGVEEARHAELRELEGAEDEGLVAHDLVGPRRHVLAGHDRGAPGSARQDLLRERETHAPGPPRSG
jgi:hypothetical protein